MSKSIRLLFALLLAVHATAWAQLIETTIAISHASVPSSPVNDWTDLQVSCPAGHIAISGGVDTSFFNVFEVAATAPLIDGVLLSFISDGTRAAPSGWYASVRNFDSVSHAVTVFAVCASLFDAVSSVASGPVAQGSVAVPGTGSAAAACPAGYSALGGGTDLSEPATMKVSATAPTFGADFLMDRPAGQSNAPTGWGGSARNEGIAGKITVAAVCGPLSGVFAVVTSAFTINAGTQSGLSAQCPAGSIALGGGIDTDDVTKNALAVSTVLLGSGPQFPADRPSGNNMSGSGWYGIYFNYGPGATTGKVGAICVQPTPGFDLVYEFYNVDLKHFFRTAIFEEALAIDQGAAGPGWIRTGDNFYAYVAGSASPGFDVCRFYTPGANSHFYTAFAPECEGLKAPNSGWHYEGLSFRIELPGPSGCAAGRKPVHRLYNDRFAFTDSNHRFTTIFSEVTRLQGLGWIYEGVAFCALG